MVPSLPFFTELVYATSTAVLFQVMDQESQFNVTLKVATLEPHSLSPSYWKFLQRITGGKLGQVRYKKTLSIDCFKLHDKLNQYYDDVPFPGQSATG